METRASFAITSPKTERQEYLLRRERGNEREIERDKEMERRGALVERVVVSMSFFVISRLRLAAGGGRSFP